MAVVVYVPSRLGEGFFTDLPAPTAGDDAKAVTYDHGTQAFVYAAAGGGGTPPGSDTQVIFNDAGAYGADAGLTYAKASGPLTVAGGLVTPSMRPASDSTTALQWQNAAGTGFVFGDSTAGRFGIGATPAGTLHAESSTGYFSVNSNSAAFGDSDTNHYLFRFSDQFTKDSFSGIALTIFRSSGGSFNFSSRNGIWSNPTIATGDIVLFKSGATFTRAGSETLTAYHVRDIISAAGVARGVYINPLIIGGPNYRGIDIENDQGWGMYQSNANIKNWLNAKTGFGNVPTPGALIDVDASTTTRASSRERAGTAPSAPNDGDRWNDGNAYAMMVNGTNAVNTDGGLSVWMQSSTTARNVGRVLWQYTDKTDATRVTEGSVTAYYQSTEHKAIRWRGGSSGPLLSFYDVATPIARQVLATGAGATVDNVISALQALGLVKQS